MIHIKKITYDDILTMWTKYMPNMSLEPTSAMSCFLMQVKNEETYKFEFIDHYDLENQKFTPTFWGAFDNDKLVGCNSGHMTMDRLYRSRGLFVQEEYRKRAIGKKLLLKTVSQAYHENAIGCWSFPKNTAWLSYARAGFQRTGKSFNFEWITRGNEVNTRCIKMFDEVEINSLVV